MAKLHFNALVIEFDRALQRTLCDVLSGGRP